MPREISLLLAEEVQSVKYAGSAEGGVSRLFYPKWLPPSQMIDSLTTLFKTISLVKRAFFCAIKEHADAQPYPLIGALRL